MDACRLDALRAVAPETPLFDTDEVTRLQSVGGASAEWIAHTFDTQYVTE